MFYKFLLVILIIDALVLIAGVLAQAAKGGGLAASFGGVTTAADAFIGTRQAGNYLSKLTWWAGGGFLFLAFLMQVLSTRAAAPRSILDQPLSQSPASAPSTQPATQVPPSAVPLSPATKSPTDSGQKKKP